MATGGYASAQDWMKAGFSFDGYLFKREQHRRIKAFGLPSLEQILIPGERVLRESRAVSAFFAKYSPLVLVSVPRHDDLRKHHKVPAHAPRDFVKFLDEVAKDAPLDQYDFLLTDMVQGAVDGFVGIGMSDGAGNALVECYVRENWWDIRILASGAAEPERLAWVWYEEGEPFAASHAPFLATPRLVHEPAQRILGIPGYFEFISGVKNGVRGAYFMEYQAPGVFTNLLGTLKDRRVWDASERLRGVLFKHDVL